MRLLLKAWGPVILWAALIFYLSTDRFSSSNTAQILELLWVFPSMSAELLETIHSFVRKSAHWAEYFVFALLLLRAFRGENGNGWKWRWAGFTLLVVLFYALSDELHQALVPSRYPRLGDAMLDFFGGCCAVFWTYLSQNRWLQFQQQKRYKGFKEP